MNQTELTKLNIGENLDALMNLDPRGYGVCRILYAGARAYTGKPLTMNAAEVLVDLVKENDIVYILTGFVLLPFRKAEMDGIIGAMLTARALVKAFGAKPVIVCPVDNLEAVRNMSYDMGLHLYETLSELQEYPVSMGVVTFTKDEKEAVKQADALLAECPPRAVISIEAPGANEIGIYHNATGLNLGAYQAKSDILFEKARKAGIPTLAIGDLGNEIGMGTIRPHILQYVPYTAKNECRCGCGGGIAAVGKADHIITATTSDWGAYGLIAALAFLTKNMDVMHTAELEHRAIHTASRSGMIDMYGWLIPAIDGFDEKISIAIVELMRECIQYAPTVEATCKHWFDRVEEKGFFGKS